MRYITTHYHDYDDDLGKPFIHIRQVSHATLAAAEADAAASAGGFPAEIVAVIPDTTRLDLIKRAMRAHTPCLV